METESSFVAPEGVYTVTEEHRHNLIGVHTITAAPVTYPTKLKTVTVKFTAAKNANSQVLSQLLGGNREKENKKEKEKQEKERLDKEREAKQQDGLSVSSSETPDDAPSPDPSTFSPSPDNVTSPTLAHEQLNSLFGGPSQAQVGKKKSAARPKHNMRTTSSTFITRLQNVDNLNRNLASKQGETTFLFYNSSKSFIWTEAGCKAKEPLARIFFAAYPTCHDVNTATSSAERIDVIIGFNTGDLLWFDPISSRYGRLNKQGRICNSPCTAVRWIPSSPNLFLVSHADGTILLYDKEREDGVFSPRDPTSTVPTDVNGIPQTPQVPPEPWNPLDSIFVTFPPWHPATIASSMSNGKTDKDKDRIPKNPVSHWRVSKKKVVDFVFSPDVKYVAAIAEDGCLRVIDAVAEQLVDCYASYFGALTCVAWSPDGRYILTGGQDDLVTIYSPWEQRVVARCQGHSSFVAAVAFDDIRCDGRTYRFGSVGEDNKLILWDFSSGALHRPKLQAAAHHQRMSMTSSVSLALRRRGESTVFLGGPGMDPPMPRYHPAPSRNEVAVLQPVLIKPIEGELLTDVIFYQRGLLTANRVGHVKLWVRPLAVHPRHLKSRTARSNSFADTDVLG